MRRLVVLFLLLSALPTDGFAQAAHNDSVQNLRNCWPASVTVIAQC